MVATRNLDQYSLIHKTKTYGNGSAKARRKIEPWVRVMKPQSLLDYGAGQSKTADLLRCKTLVIRDRYDPAIPGIDTIPRQAYDIVTCTDVVEHLDLNEIDLVLKDIRRLSPHAIIAADTRPASTILPNGENAHATVQPAQWWKEKIASVFGQAEMIEVTGTSAIFRTWNADLNQRMKATLYRVF